MKLFHPALVVGLIGLAVAGCSRDTAVHGPFLIGAERPGPAGPECRNGAVRSQDDKSEWAKCFKEPEHPVALESQSEADWKTVVSDREEDLPNETMPPSSAPSAPKRSSSRSAWN